MYGGGCDCIVVFKHEGRVYRVLVEHTKTLSLKDIKQLEAMEEHVRGQGLKAITVKILHFKRALESPLLSKALREVEHIRCHRTINVGAILRKH